MHYSSLRECFDADPLLLYDFVYMCPEEEYLSLFSKLPVSLSLTWLSFKPVSQFIEPVSFCVKYLLLFTSYPFKLSKWKPWLEEIGKKISNGKSQPQYIGHCVCYETN